MSYFRGIILALALDSLYMNICLSAAKRPSAENGLAEMRRKCVDNNPGVGNFSPVIKAKAQAEEIQFYMLRFYSRNHKRHIQLRKAQDCEELKSTIIERPDKKAQRRKGKGGKQLKGAAQDEDNYSLSSSSEDDEADYYDEEEAINFVPLYGLPSPSSRSASKSRRTPHCTTPHCTAHDTLFHVCLLNAYAVGHSFYACPKNFLPRRA